MIEVIRDNTDEKPVIYFSNGTLKEDRYYLKSFDEFVKELGVYASWTTGVGIWSDDYKKIPTDVKVDKISPHSCILFSERKKSMYIIENFIFSEDIVKGHKNKGKYDLFKAFAIEEPSITLNLFLDGDISIDTLKME